MVTLVPFSRVNALAWIVCVAALSLSTSWFDSKGREPFGELLAILVFYMVGALVAYRVDPKMRLWLTGAFTVAFCLRVIASVIIFIWVAALDPNAPIYDPTALILDSTEVRSFGVLTDDGSYFLSLAWTGSCGNSLDSQDADWRSYLLPVVGSGYCTVLAWLFGIFGRTQMVGAYWSALLTSMAVLVIYRLSKLFKTESRVACLATTLGVVFPPFILWGSVIGIDSATILCFPLLVYACSVVVSRRRVWGILGTGAVISAVALYRPSRAVPFILIGLILIAYGLFFQKIQDTTKERQLFVFMTRAFALAIVILGLFLIWPAMESAFDVATFLGNRIGANREGFSELEQKSEGVPIYRQLSAERSSLTSASQWPVLPILLLVQLYLPIFVQTLLDNLVPPWKLFELAESFMWTLWLLPLVGVAAYDQVTGRNRMNPMLWLSGVLFLVAILAYSAADTSTIRWRATALPLFLIMAALGHQSVKSGGARVEHMMVVGLVLLGSIVINCLYLAYKF